MTDVPQRHYRRAQVISGAGFLIFGCLSLLVLAFYVAVTPKRGGTSPADNNLAGLIACIGTATTCLRSFVSLCGFVFSTIFGWRQERRQASMVELERQRAELEIERHRLELERLRREAENL